ncbi:MAG: hypothetical protein P8X74_22330 [Reinekea sp.]
MKFKTYIYGLLALLLWVMGYFLVIEVSYSGAYSLYSKFGWIGFAFYLTPQVLVIVLNALNVVRTVFTLSILILIFTGLFFALLFSYESKTGGYILFQNILSLPHEPALLFSLLGSFLMLRYAKPVNSIDFKM